MFADLNSLFSFLNRMCQAFALAFLPLNYFINKNNTLASISWENKCDGNKIVVNSGQTSEVPT